MRHQFVFAFGAERHFPYRQSFAQLQQPAIGDHGPRGGLAQEVDREIGRDGEPHRSDGAKDREILVDLDTLP